MKLLLTEIMIFKINKSLFYNLKSVKVRWNNNDSYLHVFINTTQIKKLEEERANTKCQQFMFASLSHDMRTPLNAITNSLQLISITFDEFKKSFVNFRKISQSYETLQPRLSKYF